MPIRKEDIDDLGPLAQMVVTNLNTIDSFIASEDRRNLKALKQDPKELILKAVNASEDVAQQIVTPSTIERIAPIIVRPPAAPIPVIQASAPKDTNQLEFNFVREPLPAVQTKIITLQDISKDVEKIKSDLKILKELVLEIKQNTAKRKRKNEDKADTGSTGSWEAVPGTVSSTSSDDPQ